MSASELEKLERELKPLVKLIGAIRFLVAACFACITAIGTGAVWVSGQASAIAANAAAVKSIAEERKVTTAEWTVWRRQKDEADTKLITLLENQQRLLESHQRWIERQRQ